MFVALVIFYLHGAYFTSSIIGHASTALICESVGQQIIAENSGKMPADNDGNQADSVALVCVSSAEYAKRAISPGQKTGV